MSLPSKYETYGTRTCANRQKSCCSFPVLRMEAARTCGDCCSCSQNWTCLAAGSTHAAKVSVRCSAAGSGGKGLGSELHYAIVI